MTGKVIKMTIVKVSNSKIVFYYEVIYKLSIVRYTYFTYSFMNLGNKILVLAILHILYQQTIINLLQ